MKLVLNSKQDLKKFHEWLTDKIGELNTMELEDIAREAFMAGMRESQNVIAELRGELAEYVELHSKVASELNTANHKLMQIEDLAKRESGLTKRAADLPERCPKCEHIVTRHAHDCPRHHENTASR